MKTHIFVYGLLKSMYENEPAKFIRKNCSLVGEGYFPGQLIDIGSYPGALYERGSETNVYGEIYCVERNEAELVKYLDHFEGVGPQFEQPNEYIREVIPVQMGDEVLQASCYLYNWPVEGKRTIKSGRYENKDGTR